MQKSTSFNQPVIQSASTSRRRSRPVQQNGKGISNRRIRVDDRNRVMIARYYYWTEIRRMRFDDVMRILSEKEFFVEDRTISNALLDLSTYLDELYNKKVSTRSLKNQYPSWNWCTN